MPKPANGRRRCSIKNQRCLVTSGGVSGRGSGGRRRRSKDCQREARYGFVEGDFFAAFAPAASFLLSQSQVFFPKTSLSFSMDYSVVSCTVGLAFRTAFAPIGGPVALAASMFTNVSPNMPAVSSKTLESFGIFSSYGGLNTMTTSTGEFLTSGLARTLFTEPRSTPAKRTGAPARRPMAFIKTAVGRFMIEHCVREWNGRSHWSHWSHWSGCGSKSLDQLPYDY